MLSCATADPSVTRTICQIEPTKSNWVHHRTSQLYEVNHTIIRSSFLATSCSIPLWEISHLLISSSSSLTRSAHPSTCCRNCTKDNQQANTLIVRFCTKMRPIVCNYCHVLHECCSHAAVRSLLQLFPGSSVVCRYSYCTLSMWFAPINKNRDGVKWEYCSHILKCGRDMRGIDK